MNEKWRPERDELDENIAALRRMRAIVWMFLALLFGALCFFVVPLYLMGGGR